MKKLFYLFVAVVVLALLLWLFAPVQRLYPVFAERLQPVQASQLKGSLYKGQAGQITWAGIDLGQLQWNQQWPTLSGGIKFSWTGWITGPPGWNALKGASA